MGVLTSSSCLIASRRSGNGLFGSSEGKAAVLGVFNLGRAVLGEMGDLGTLMVGGTGLGDAGSLGGEVEGMVTVGLE